MSFFTFLRCMIFQDTTRPILLLRTQTTVLLLHVTLTRALHVLSTVPATSVVHVHTEHSYLSHLPLPVHAWLNYNIDGIIQAGVSLTSMKLRCERM